MHKAPEIFPAHGEAHTARPALRVAAALAIGLALMAGAHARPGQEPLRIDRPAPATPPQLQRPDLARQELAREELRALEEQQRRMMEAQQQRLDRMQPANEPARRQGHLTPDQRLELRRQINEVGQDIYVDKRRR